MANVHCLPWWWVLGASAACAPPHLQQRLQLLRLALLPLQLGALLGRQRLQRLCLRRLHPTSTQVVGPPTFSSHSSATQPARQALST